VLRPVSYYARELKSALPRPSFEPAHSRLWWLPIHVGVISLGITSLAAGWVPWLAAGIVSLVIGSSFGGLTFLAHETMHGAIVRGRRLRYLVGAIGFLPFLISPRLWVAWHNRVHHGHTQHAGIDPDAYPTLAEYQKHHVLRIMTDHLGPGGRRPNGALSLLIGFSIQSAHMLFGAKALGLLSPRQRVLALIESGAAAAGWALLALVIGWPAFLFAYVLPMFVANFIVMGFILTNHSLSPLSDVNDPLFNSLSVTAPRWVEWLTLRFGFHVEHHLFPWMSSRHAPLVRSLIQRHWPERYQSMPIGRALLALHRTGRVYKDDTTLADMVGGKESLTLLPRDWDSKGLTPLVPRPAVVAAAPIARHALGALAASGFQGPAASSTSRMVGSSET
jgi:fatty acid desaturase